MKKFLSLIVSLFLSLAAFTPYSAFAESGFLGLEVQGVDETLSKVLGQDRKAGVLVKNVAVGEAGAIAGFRRGDLIIEFNRVTIRNFDSLLKVVVKTKPGQKVPVTVLRNNDQVKLNLDLGMRPDSWKVTKGAFANYPDIGITVAAITKKVRERFGLRWDSLGVVVTLIDSKSKVVATGLTPGDVIVQANLQDIWHPKQLTDVIEVAKSSKKEEILLLIESPSGFRYSLMPLKK